MVVALGVMGAGVLAQAQEAVIISEFLASNVGGLVDEDGESSDWIELYNSGASAVNLAGWSLTDDATDPTRWSFPPTNIAAKGFLVVFASGKDRAVPGAPLHTSFQLNADGGYLALVKPDGQTIVSEFANYPEQRANFSYGLGQTVVVTRLVASNAPARILVPTSGTLGSSWVDNDFNDAVWSSGTNGVGYETTVPGFAVRNFKANVQVGNLSAAQGVINTPAQQTSVVGTNISVINFNDSQGDGHYGQNNAFPGQGQAQNVDDFVLEITGTVTIPAAGNWTFGVSSDDGFRLTVGSFTVLYDPPRAPGDTLGVFNVPAAGDYPLRLLYYERGGGAEVELFAAQGTFGAWGANFRLVGDTANGGLAVRSLPVAGSGGTGYRSMIRTDVQTQMLSNNPSAYIRIPFNVADAAALTSLTLSARYDDGLIAWINGVEVARRNAPASPQWNSTASAAHSALTAEDINLSDRLNLLQDGSNLLAIHGLNDSATSPDFYLAAELAEIRAIATSNQYFNVPTPGAVNSSGTFSGFVADTKFSHDRGFYEQGFSCVITTATAGATVRYTRNGSWPSTTNGTAYTGPILITNTTVLRAIAYKTGLLPSDVDTETYLFVNDVVRQSPTGTAPPGWPSSWGANVVDYGMDPDIVNNAVWGATIRDDLKSLPSFSIVMDLNDLFSTSRGIYANPSGDEIAWERPCSLELIHPDGTPGFQINCGIRIRGGFSRSTDNPKHAFRFFFRQEYGEAKLHYPLFGDQGADAFDKIDLRTFQNYSWSFQNDGRMICLRDQFSRDAQLIMSGTGERGDFCHLYINGQYWGLYNTDERPEAAFGETYFGGQAEDYDTIKVDPDIGYVIEATDGSTAAWFRLWQAATNGFGSDVEYFKVQGLNVDSTVNPAYENLLDVDNLIDYMLVILYGGNLDAPISNFLGNNNPNNFFAVRNRTGQYGGFRFLSHDAEHTLLNVNEDRTGIANGVIQYTAGNPVSQGAATAFTRSSPQYVWFRLQQNAEFRLRVADHAQRHCFNGGILTPEGARASLLTRSNEIYRAIVCESARWGDAKRATPFTRNDWASAMRTVFGSFVSGRTTALLNQLRADNLYPNVSAPTFNQYGGFVSNGFNLLLTNRNPSSALYYTLNGADPRVRGGGVNPAALAYTAGTPIPINFQTTVRTRVLSNNVWSAVVEATFYVAQDFSKLVVTEIMYNPSAWDAYASDDLEYLELKNTGLNTLDLSGLSFTAGITFTFPDGTRLLPGQFFVLGRNRAALTNRYPGLIVHGVYSGRLDNGGEKLTISHLLGGSVLSFDYNDAGRWPRTPDGMGFSLVARDPDANSDPDKAAHWRASTAPGGSPGTDDPPNALAPVVVNEALTHTVLPAVDRIELYNPNEGDVPIGGWFLTDDPASPQKFRIPDGTVIPAGGFRSFTEADFNNPPGASNAFALSALADEVFLFSGDAQTNLTGYSHGFSFAGADNGVSFGRHVNSAGDEDFVAQISPSFDAANAGPRVGPLVFSEIMYHPPDFSGGLDNALDEYLLVQNITGEAVPLFDPETPTNTWRLRGGSDFDWPTNVTVPPAQAVLLVNFDPADTASLAAFRAKFGLLAGVPAYGPFSGRLDNSRQNLELYKPGPPTTNGVPYVLVERVEYRDAFPWPPGPDGSGSVLKRRVLAAYGNEPTNWYSSAPLTITMQPRSLIVTNGSNAVFSVSAIGTGPLRYQWRFNDADLPGATDATLTLVAVGLTNSGTYKVIVSDDSGSAESAAATLIVLVRPTITLHPTSQTVAEGGSASFSIAAVGTVPMSFRWRRNGVTFTNALILSAPSNSVLTLTNVAITNNGANFTVVVTNLAGQGIPPLSSNAVLTVLADTDRDGLPDEWEMANGLDSNDPGDANQDSDGDTMSNRHEYIAGTDPQDRNSSLRLEADRAGSRDVVLRFLAVSNRTYAVLYSEAITEGPWLGLANISAAPSNRTILVTNSPAAASGRFYRLVTPSQ